MTLADNKLELLERKFPSLVFLTCFYMYYFSPEKCLFGREKVRGAQHLAQKLMLSSNDVQVQYEFVESLIST